MVDADNAYAVITKVDAQLATDRSVPMPSTIGGAHKAGLEALQAADANANPDAVSAKLTLLKPVCGRPRSITSHVTPRSMLR